MAGMQEQAAFQVHLQTHAIDLERCAQGGISTWLSWLLKGRFRPVATFDWPEPTDSIRARSGR